MFYRKAVMDFRLVVNDNDLAPRTHPVKFVLRF